MSPYYASINRGESFPAANQVRIRIDTGRRKRRVAAMNPTQKQFSLNRAASRKQIPISNPGAGIG